MALKSDQQRVMGLLKDTITLLCKNGLTFETKFAIDAVIGVTIDEKDLFYLSMNEIVKSDTAPPDSSTKTGVARIEQSDSDGQLSGEEAHTASGKKRRKRKRPVKQEESGSDGENGIQSDGGGSDDADVSRLEDSGSGIPSPRKKSNIKVESGGDDDADIVFVKQELDDSWSQSIAQDGENSSYQGYPNTSMSQSDFSQDPNFSADNSLVAMGLANDSGMWAQNVGGSPGQPRPFRPRGPRSFTATTPGQQADGDGQLTGQDNLQNMEELQPVRRTRRTSKKADKSGLIKSEKSTSSPQSEKAQNKGERTFQCEECDAKYSRRSYLQDHVLAVHKGLRFSCSQCVRSYSSRQGLDDHIRSAHEKRHRYTCERCGKGFMMKCDFLSHIDSHDNIKKYECEQCSSLYASQKALNRHLQNCKRIGKDKQEKPKSVCFVCKALSSRPDVLKEHVERVHKNQEA